MQAGKSITACIRSRDFTPSFFHSEFRQATIGENLDFHMNFRMLNNSLDMSITGNTGAMSWEFVLWCDDSSKMRAGGRLPDLAQGKGKAESYKTGWHGLG